MLTCAAVPLIDPIRFLSSFIIWMLNGILFEGKTQADEQNITEGRKYTVIQFGEDNYFIISL